MSDRSVLIVEDDNNLRDALLATLNDSCYDAVVAADGQEALRIVDSQSVGLVLSDIQMEPMSGIELLDRLRREHPELPTVMMTAFGSVSSAVDAMRNGASDYLLKPFDNEQLVQVIDKHIGKSGARVGKDGTASNSPADPLDGKVIAADSQSINLLSIAARAAATNVTITLHGESGTGKEVLARYIHSRSPRRDGPFVAINCAAIPENMLEAMLFGHEKGAFTGASNAREGKFEQANGGTLLLDEISEMDLALQAKLLRVLQEREVERIGGRETIPLDVRVLATTNRNLRRSVDEGRFREDLFYRLNVFPLHIPPLRSRPDDIVPLAQSFVAARTDSHIETDSNTDNSRITFSQSALASLEDYPWPGNVRELQNVIARSMILLQSNVIDADDLLFETDDLSEGCERTSGDSTGLQDELRDHEFQLVVDALRETAGQRQAAAKHLGISPRTLRYKLARMREAGIPIPDSRAVRSMQ